MVDLAVPVAAALEPAAVRPAPAPEPVTAAIRAGDPGPAFGPVRPAIRPRALQAGRLPVALTAVEAVRLRRAITAAFFDRTLRRGP